ncbi:MAG: SDR family NAD(P)-dependent oxidoreductase [Dehalococcoidia bacterium]
MKVQSTLLEGKVAVITGASRGIGRAIALTYAENGADVALCATNGALLSQVAEEVHALGRRALTIIMDVSKEEDAQRMARETLEAFGQIDILVNNAGIISRETPVWRTTVEEWDRVMGVNLRGAHLCSRAVLAHMVERRSGFIVNIGSISGLSAGGVNPGDDGAYTPSKWGLLGYTAVLAKSVRPYGIRVNAINPGLVATDMGKTSRTWDVSAPQSSPEEVAAAALFLVTAASPDMSGQFIDLFERR